MVQRGRPPGEGLWALPGGKVRAGEGMRAAAERELLEETGVSVQAGELAWEFEYIEHDAQGRLRFHYVILDFHAHYLGGTPRAGDDAAAARWVGFAEIPTLPLHPETKRLLCSLYPERLTTLM